MALYRKYKEKIKEFDDERAKLPKLKTKLTRLQRRLDRAAKDGATVVDDLTSQIEALSQRISDIETDAPRQAYMLQVAPYLDQFEREEKLTTQVVERMKGNRDQTAALASFLSKLPNGSRKRKAADDGDDSANTQQVGGWDDEYDDDSQDDDDAYLGLGSNTLISKMGGNPRKCVRGGEWDVYAQYLADVEHDRSKLDTNVDDHSRCSNTICNGKTIMTGNYEAVCAKCGCVTQVLPESDPGTFKEPAIYVQPAYSYKKKNHFRDWLAKSQGKESTEVPSQVFDALLNELKMLRTTDAKSVTRKLLRQLLRKLKMSKYYGNLSQIHYKLTGEVPPQFTQDQEETLMEMFMQLEPVYERVKPPGRDNFMSYEYVIHKFCELQYEMTDDEEWTTNLKFFKLLKGKKKLYDQDQMWKKCCRELNWMFIKSLT